MAESGVLDVLRKVFIYIGYPAVIIAAFWVIVLRMRALFAEYEGDRLMQWRLAVAGLLPVAVLTFVVVGSLPEAIPWSLGVVRWEFQLPLGALLAIVTLEASQHVSGSRQALSFMLYLSVLGVGLLYIVMEGGLARFQPAVFAVVVTGGLHFVFREPDSHDAESPQRLERWTEDGAGARPERSRHERGGSAELKDGAA
jgi:hypothetical protein